MKEGLAKGQQGVKEWALGSQGMPRTQESDSPRARRPALLGG